MTEDQHVTTTREDAYRLLAACYYPPTAKLLEEQCCISLANILKQTVPDAAQHASKAAQAIGADLKSLLVEHARLFIGPFHLIAPPYGSIYIDDSKTVMGDSTPRVAAFYHSCGLRLADNFHELPDHFAVELEFMSFLAFKQREAEVSGNKDEVTRIVSLQREFLDRFLMPWLTPFTSAIISDGEAPFYQAIAHCTAAFVNADNDVLNRASNG